MAQTSSLVADFDSVRDDITQYIDLFREDEPSKTYCPDGEPLRCFSSRAIKERVKQLYTITIQRNNAHFTMLSGEGDGTSAERFWETVVGLIGPGSGMNREKATSKHLAILLYLKVRLDDGAWQAFVKHCSMPRRQSNTEKREAPEWPLRDSSLPYSSFETIKAIFGNHEAFGARFYEKQWVFCPLILHWGHEKVLLDHRADFQRMPWETEERIGEGGFGEVYKVKIDGKLYARKDVKVKLGSTSNEWIMAEHFRNRLDSNKLILKFEAAIRTPTKVSMIFDLAICDLDQCLRGHKKFGKNDSEQLSNGPSGYTGKRPLFQKVVDLVGALKFLQYGFKDAYERDMSFLHLDLKPANILVFRQDGEVVLKIADFSISAVISHGSPFEDTRAEVRDLRDHYLTRDEVSVTGRLPDQATCLPPEALGAASNKKHINRQCDIWGVGCVLALFLVWLHGGPSAYESFIAETLKQGGVSHEVTREDGIEVIYDEPKNHRFFSLVTEEPADTSSYQTELEGRDEEPVTFFCVSNPAIPAKMNQILRDTTKAREKRLYTQLCDLLKSRVLLPEPDKRISMKDLHAQLKIIANSGRNPESSSKGDEAGSKYEASVTAVKSPHRDKRGNANTTREKHAMFLETSTQPEPGLANNPNWLKATTDGKWEKNPEAILQDMENQPSPNKRGPRPRNAGRADESADAVAGAHINRPSNYDPGLRNIEQTANNRPSTPTPSTSRIPRPINIPRSTPRTHSRASGDTNSTGRNT